ncbi:MAG: SdiA-regulated domain-containing protein [Oceanipulchritudo sp.]
MARMHLLQAILLVVFLFVGGCRPELPGNGRAAVDKLELVRAWPVEGPGLLEPSGLAMRNGTLFTVADKVQDTVFRVRLGDEAAHLVPHLQFTPPAAGAMDWEGVALDPEGVFHLVSETRARLARINPDGTATWASPDLREEGGKAGLFRKRNAGLEGITSLGADHWIAAVEREPRGLIEWDAEETRIFTNIESPSMAALPLLRLPDFAGLDAGSDGRTLYALFRNAHLVVRLVKDSGDWRETAAWSYRALETDPRWAFQAQLHGQAEGLVVRGRDVFLIFDNNRGGRQADPSDRRPLLIQARFPDPD